MQRRRSVKPRFWAFLIAFMLVCFTASGAVAQIHYNRAADRVFALGSEKLALINRINHLNSQLDYVQTDAYVQRVARDELNMIMPGEIRYVSN